MPNSSSKKKNTAKAGSTASKTAKKKKQVYDEDYYFDRAEEKTSGINRMICGALFLILAIILIIGMFDETGMLTQYVQKIIKGLVGQGYWIVIPSFLIVAYILFFHEGKPVVLRVFCMLFLPVLFGALLYIFCNVTPFSDNFADMTEIYYTQGQNMEFGGVLSAYLGYGLTVLISTTGAVIFILIGMFICIVLGLNGSIVNAVDSFKKRHSGGKRPVTSTGNRQQNNAAALSSRNGTQKSSIDPEKLVIANAGRQGKGISEDSINGGSKRTSGTARKTVQPVVEKYDDEIEDFPETSESFGSEPEDEVKAPERILPMVTKYNEETSASIVKPTKQARTGKSAGAAPAAGEPRNTEPSAAPVQPEKRTRRERPVISKADLIKETDAIAAETAEAGEKTPADYSFPPVGLLDEPENAAGDGRHETDDVKHVLENTLKSFDVTVSVSNIVRGPTVTRYEFKLPNGTRLSKITNLNRDIELALGVRNVRIGPVENQMSMVGIEVPNRETVTVHFRELMESDAFIKAKSKLTFGIGKDIAGNCICGNISKLPHMLIAGTTGSGKSVCMNSLILSILYKAKPDEVKLIMIDPKMVELGIYNGIPHMSVPVVTDPKKAAGALQWSVVEMLRRYSKFSSEQVRDLAGYNAKIKERMLSGDENCEERPMPQIVIIIDELADLMMASAKEVEESIVRVAQMGRAAGMHLVVATQRPSSDIITGVMKANIPSRIAFAVSSSLESRIILDQTGAEKLIGKGDMLYYPIGAGRPERIQGAYVSDEERERVIDYIKQTYTQTQSDENNAEIQIYMEKSAMAKQKNSDGMTAAESSGSPAVSDYDEMVPQAVEAVITAKSCSTSMLQRKLKLGYSRAARVVDQLEELGVVGPYEGAKPRSVVITREEWRVKAQELGFETSDIPAVPETGAEADEE